MLSLPIPLSIFKEDVVNKTLLVLTLEMGIH
jgi:hypothetical protein